MTGFFVFIATVVEFEPGIDVTAVYCEIGDCESLLTKIIKFEYDAGNIIVINVEFAAIDAPDCTEQ